MAETGVLAHAVASVEEWTILPDLHLDAPPRGVTDGQQTSKSATAAGGETPVALEGAWSAFLELSQSLDAFRLAYCSMFKRWIDAAVAAVLLLVLCPIWIVAALAIRCDSRGPILFRQERIGRYGRPFTVYKLRTMVTDPNATLRWFDAGDGRRLHKRRDDPRVTRAGSWLRRTSIDELPQLLNVIRGEMSLIGPRPELPEIVAAYRPWQHRRHLVRPGLTGWWQIQGRSDRPMHEHTELDLYYVQNLSFGLDLRILARTVRVVLGGSGAF